jgi:hypothetical protein
MIDAYAQGVDRHRIAVKILKPRSEEAEGPVETFVFRNWGVSNKKTRAVQRLALVSREHNRNILVLLGIWLVLAY